MPELYNYSTMLAAANHKVKQPQPSSFDHEKVIKTHYEAIAELQEQFERHNNKKR